MHIPVEGTWSGQRQLIPIKNCPPIKKAVSELVKSMVEWRLDDRDEGNNWLLEGRTVLIFKGGDRKDPANYRPITCPQP